MPIRVIAVGKTVQPWLAAVQEYEKRLGRYDRLEVIELPDLREPQHMSDAALEEHVRREGELICKRLRHDDHVIALCIEGKQHTSEVFAEKLSALRVSGKTPCFVIGGSLGLSREVVARSDEQLSLSQMTYPHQMARAVLAEQLYRAFKIIGGERYHK